MGPDRNGAVRGMGVVPCVEVVGMDCTGSGRSGTFVAGSPWTDEAGAVVVDDRTYPASVDRTACCWGFHRWG